MQGMNGLLVNTKGKQFSVLIGQNVCSQPQGVKLKLERNKAMTRCETNEIGKGISLVKLTAFSRVTCLVRSQAFLRSS